MIDEMPARHGGQSWYSDFPVIDDLSVTCNAFGVPQHSLKFVADNLANISRYPPDNWEPARGALFSFLRLDKQAGACRSDLLLGNGASELIDVLLRYLASTGKKSYSIGPDIAQYREYERVAQIYGMSLALTRQEADVHLVVNPNNPTGTFLSYSELKEYIHKYVRSGAAVVVDESMLPWLGPDWYRESLLSNVLWIQELFTQFSITIFVIQSWTKLWSCCGLRIGSLMCPSNKIAAIIKDLLVPWNVNILALHYLQKVVTDHDFLEMTWRETPKWRARLSDALHKTGMGWKVYGEQWLPWIWLDVLEHDTAKRFVEASIDIGLPVRYGGNGYNQPTCVRIRVCSAEHEALLFHSLRRFQVI